MMELRQGVLPEGHTLTEDQARIIRWCMEEDPCARPTASQLLADKAVSADVEDFLLHQKAMQLAKLGDVRHIWLLFLVCIYHILTLTYLHYLSRFRLYDFLTERLRETDVE